MLAEADIRVGGDRPWDIQIHNEGLYKRVFREGTLGAGEAYLEGWWDCEQLDVLFCKALHAHLENKVRHNLPNALVVASQLLFNLQSVARPQWSLSSITIWITPCSRGCSGLR